MSKAAARLELAYTLGLEKLATPVLTKAPDSEWIARVKARNPSNLRGVAHDVDGFPPGLHLPLRARRERAEIITTFQERMFEAGGWQFCLSFDDDLMNIIAKGRFYPVDSSTYRKIPLPEGHCHSNVGHVICEGYSPALVAMSGYALSDDGVWRSHSWLAEPNTSGINLIETTSERVCYFGIPVPKHIAASWDEWNELDPTMIEDWMKANPAGGAAPRMSTGL